MAHLAQLAEVPPESPDQHEGLPDWFLAALVSALQERRSRWVWVMPIQRETAGVICPEEMPEACPVRNLIRDSLGSTCGQCRRNGALGDRRCPKHLLCCQLAVKI